MKIIEAIFKAIGFIIGAIIVVANLLMYLLFMALAASNALDGNYPAAIFFAILFFGYALLNKKSDA